MRSEYDLACDLAGERGLLTDERRSATVLTISACRLLKIDKLGFVTYLGSLHAELVRRWVPLMIAVDDGL